MLHLKNAGKEITSYIPEYVQLLDFLNGLEQR